VSVESGIGRIDLKLGNIISIGGGYRNKYLIIEPENPEKV
jgi:hypothetical protein